MCTDRKVHPREVFITLLSVALMAWEHAEMTERTDLKSGIMFLDL